jgi:hypothetical protein
MVARYTPRPQSHHWGRLSLHSFDVVSNSWMMDGSVSNYWIKCLIIENSLCLWESSGYKYHFIFLDTSISCMYLFPLQSLSSLDRTFMAYYDINWSNWINNCLPLNFWGGEADVFSFFSICLTPSEVWRIDIFFYLFCEIFYVFLGALLNLQYFIA